MNQSIYNHYAFCDRFYRIIRPLRLLTFMMLALAALTAAAQPSYLRSFLVGEDLLVLEITRDNAGKLTGTLSLAQDASKKTDPFPVYTESFENFLNILSTQYRSLFDQAKQQANMAVIKTQANIIFREVILYQFSESSTTPPSGELLLSNHPQVDSITTINIPCNKNNRRDLANALLRKNKELTASLEKQYSQIETFKEDNLLDLKELRKNDREFSAEMQKYQSESGYLDTLKKQINSLVKAIPNDTSLKKFSTELIAKLESAVNFRSAVSIYKNKLSEINAKDIVPTKDSILYYLDEIVKYFDFGSAFDNASRKDLKALIKRLGEQNFHYSERIQTIDLVLKKLKQKESLEENLMKIRAELFDDKSKTGIKGLIKSTKAFDSVYNKNLKLFSDDQIRRATVVIISRVLQQERLLTVEKFNPDTAIIFGSIKVMYDTILGIQYRLESLESNFENQIETLINDTVEESSEHLLALSKFKAEDSISIKKENNKHDSIIDAVKKHIELLEKTCKIINTLITKADFLAEESGSLLTSIGTYSERRKAADELFQQMRNIKGEIKNVLERPALDIKALQFEFGDGMMKNILVEGSYKLKPVIFMSKRPVPFSSLTHFENLKKVELYDVLDGYKTRLDRIIRYKPAFNVGAEDYAPSDSAYLIGMNGEDSKAVIMMKEKTSQILEAKAYTDLMGFGVDQPNGIIQFEINKKIPIWTQRISLTPYKYRSFVSFFSYYRPQFNLSKIEMKDKFYYPQHLDYENNKPAISTLDLYRYSNMSLKAINFCVVNFEIVEVKTSFEFNGGFTFLTTPVKDTLFSGGKEQQWLAVSGMPFAEFAVRVKPDTRYGVSLSANLGWLFLWDQRLQQINDPEQPQSSKSYNRDLWTFQFDAFYKPFRQSEGALFFRLANVHTFPFNMNYLQVQVGYAFNLLKKAGAK